MADRQTVTDWATQEMVQALLEGVHQILSEQSDQNFFSTILVEIYSFPTLNIVMQKFNVVL